LAAIRFDCGTTVLLQGPAEFALNSPECGTLRSGRLVSKADSELATASGFKILTGNTEIVDQGTEFGVFADAGGSTEVHVFDGVARVRQRGVLHGAIPERELKAGQATRFEAPPAASPDNPVNRLDGPVGIAFGPDGNLYVASRFTDSILRYDGHTGALLDTFVPPRSGELNNPFFLTFGPDGQLYVSSTGNHAVLRFDGRTGEFRDAFVPPRAGDVAGPMGLAFGRDGNLYVASSGKQTVCRFDGQTGAYLGKVFESRSGDLDGPTGIAFGPDGDLWVADRNRDCILRFATQTGEFLARHTLDDRLKFPFDVAFQPSGQLYVASHANHQILKFDPATNRTLAGIDESQAPSWPQALTFGPDGRLYCTSDSANAVMRYDAASGAFVDAFVVSWQDLAANRQNFVMEMPNRVVCNTGVSRAGSPMRPGEHCPRWFIEKSPDPRFIPPGPAVVTSALADWRPNSDRSSWLSIAPVREDFRAAAGEYIFYAGFEVKPHEVGQARLVGQAWTPQQIVEVQVNKQPVPVTIESRPEGQATEFVIDQGFVVGLNFVYFIVTNPSEGPVAFRAELDYVRNREEREINHQGTKGTKKDG
ncbi:MAG: SMP-30/gluconolactonase/LRE family protein, partial [Planctomycetaceae bacterium]|nr:SMP-30/gluconolactonase/LRE family protein [Planctomycetaceae bacterium]